MSRQSRTTDRGTGDSSKEVDELLSPDSHGERLKPQWWRALFPALPHQGDDEESDGRARALFPTATAVREYIALQLVRLQLLQRIRNSLMGGARTRARIRSHYAHLGLDEQLLESIRTLIDFDASMLELVHDCSSDELHQLQRQNLQLMSAMLRTLRLLTLEPEDAATLGVADRLCQRNSAEVLLSILEAHSDQLHLDWEAHDSPRAVQSSDSVLRTLRCSLVEDALRCLHAQLDSVTPGSVHRINLLKQIYLHIPSQMHTPPLSAIRALAECDAGAGSPSEIIRMLIQLAACGSATLVELSVGILSHVARVRIPNEHVHSTAVCGNSEHCFYTRPLCTRGSPPTPVITYPAHTNSTLAVASKLFVFPRRPAQHLAERGLLTALMQKLQPFLAAPINPSAHTHTTQLGKTALSRSMFGGSKECDEEDESESAMGAVLPMPLPCSPLSRSTRSSSHAHDSSPHHHGIGHRGGSEEEGARHAPLIAQAAFMDELYCTPKVAEADSAIMQFPMIGQPASFDCKDVPVLELAPPALSDSSEQSTSGCGADQQPTPHHHSAPPHQSNATIATAFKGLVALSSHNAQVSAYLCGQPGLLSFLASCLAHGHAGLRLLAAELVGVMERSLACAIGSAGAPPHPDHHACASNRTAAGAPSHSLVTAAQQLAAAAATRPRSLSRRNSESAGGGPGRVPKSNRDRRNSRDLTHSPHMMPSSPLLQAHKSPGVHAGSSPHLLALAAPALAFHRPAFGSQFASVVSLGGEQQSTLLIPAEAHKQMAPLVQRTLHLLLSILRQQLAGGESLAELRHRTAAPLDGTVLQQSIDSLGTLVAHSAQLQEQASVTVPLLSVLLKKTASASLRLSALRTLAALCSRHSANSQAAVESEVVHTLMGLLAQLHSIGAARVRSTRTPSASPLVIELQQAALHLFTRLGRFALAEDLIASSSWSQLDDGPALEALSGPQAVAALMVRLLSLLDSASLPLRVTTARLLGELLLPRSPVREMLVRAGVVAKLARLSGESYAWQANDCGHFASFDVENECSCSSAGSLAPTHQLRILALRALANLTSDAPMAFKRAVLDELSVDGLLAPLADAECNDDPARSAHCICECACRGGRQLEIPGWSLLRSVLEPPTPSDAEETSTVESNEDPLMSVRDLARVLDCVVAHAGRIRLQRHGVQAEQGSTANDSSASSTLQLLAAIAARSDSSKALICARPQLLELLHAALQQQMGAAARWGSIALASLLQRADGELKAVAPPVAPTSVQSSPSIPPVAGRARALLEHDGLFPQLLLMAAPTSSGSETCVISAPLRQSNFAGAAVAASCASPSSDACEVRSRSTQCLLLMHAALKEAGASAAAASLQSERGVLLEDFIRSLPKELTNQLRKSEPVTADAAPLQEADEPSASSDPSPSSTPAPISSIADLPFAGDESADEADGDGNDHAVTVSDAGGAGDSDMSAWELFMDAGSNPAMAESDESESEDRELAITPSLSEPAVQRRGHDSAAIHHLAAEARELTLAVRTALSPSARLQSDAHADQSRRILLTLAARLVVR